ncbi:MAG TPA: hypothetical protein VNH11_06160 [Pirellulales bacterium]|nr:hypothetical protein [Pirellulales bacterium]
MNKKYIVRLTDEERAVCEATIKKEAGKSEKLRRATILLKADANGPASLYLARCLEVSPGLSHSPANRWTKGQDARLAVS